MKRETAYKIAIDAIIDRRRRHAFGHNLVEMLGDSSISSKRDSKHYQRFAEAIKILEAERDHKQLGLLEMA